MAAALTAFSPLAAPAPIAARGHDCWQVIHFDDDHLTFVDLDDGYYIEYRMAKGFVPAAEVNPRDQRIYYRLLIHHDIVSDAPQRAMLTVEMRDRESGELQIPPDDANQLLTAAWVKEGSGNEGPAITTDTDWIPIMSVSNMRFMGRNFTVAPGGEAIFTHLMTGGQVQLRYRQSVNGATLNADLRTAFPADIKQQAESRAAARTALADRDRTGQCPLHHDD